MFSTTVRWGNRSEQLEHHAHFFPDLKAVLFMVVEGNAVR